MMEGNGMNQYEVQERSPQLLEALFGVWEAEIRQIKDYVPQALMGVAHLIVAEEEDGKPVAFMGTEGHRLEMLFLANRKRGQGLGRQLLQYGIAHYGVQEVTVNEQNPQAVGFYQHMGFQTYKRTDLDEEGNPYPLLYMKLA